MKRILLGILGLALFVAQAQASTCNVTEFRLVIVAGVQVAQMPPIADQAPITVTGVSAQSSAFNAETGLIRLWCDTQSSAAVAVNPTATTSNMPMPAGAQEYFAVTPGGTAQKAAFILRP